MYSCKINSLNSLSLYFSESKYLLMIMIIQLLSFVFNLTLLKYCSVNKKPNSIINTLPNTNKVFLFIRNYANEDQFFLLLTLNSKQRSLFDFLWLLKLKKDWAFWTNTWCAWIYWSRRGGFAPATSLHWVVSSCVLIARAARIFSC